jgi:hypothetical protein
MKPVGKGSGYYIFEVLETGVIVKLTRTCFTSRAEAEQSLRTEPRGGHRPAVHRARGDLGRSYAFLVQVVPKAVESLNFLPPR